MISKSKHFKITYISPTEIRVVWGDGVKQYFSPTMFRKRFGVDGLRKKVGDVIDLNESSNPKDTIKLDVPLFIRLLEYAREEAKTDMDLHQLTDNIIEMCQEGRVLSMDDYDYVLPNQEEAELREFFRKRMQ